MSTDPIQLDCPVKCLKLSAKAYRRLIYAPEAPFDAPRTVQDVIKLAEEGRLDKIRGVGPILIAEIEASLIRAGFVVGHSHH